MYFLKIIINGSRGNSPPPTFFLGPSKIISSWQLKLKKNIK